MPDGTSILTLYGRGTDIEINRESKIEEIRDGKVVWRLSWKETNDGTHYDEIEETFEEE